MFSCRGLYAVKDVAQLHIRIKVLTILVCFFFKIDIRIYFDRYFIVDGPDIAVFLISKLTFKKGKTPGLFNTLSTKAVSR